MSSIKKKPLRFKIYYMATGFGLQKDARIIQQALAHLGFSCEVIQLAVRKERHSALTRFMFEVLRKFNFLFIYDWLIRRLPDTGCVAIHLETIAYEKLYLRERHLLVPNQEWFDTSTLDLLPFMDVVWCKSKLAKNIFNELRVATQYIGFRSDIDGVALSEQKDRGYFFCRTGMSQYRGAQNVIDVWRRHPEWPRLKIVIHPSRRPENCPANVEYLDIFGDINEYYRLASSSLFHIYMTEAEGFGHSIVEAMGYGAVVLVTNAPPMNELANNQCALLVDSSYCGHKMLSPRFAANPQAIEAAVEKVLAMPQAQIDDISHGARAQYAFLSREFMDNMARAVSLL